MKIIDVVRLMPELPDGKLVYGLRAAHEFLPGKLCFIGGKIEHDQRAIEALVSESSQEASFAFKSATYICSQSPNPSKGNLYRESYFHCRAKNLSDFMPSEEMDLFVALALHEAMARTDVIAQHASAHWVLEALRLRGRAPREWYEANQLFERTGNLPNDLLYAPLEHPPINLPRRDGIEEYFSRLKVSRVES